MEQKEIIEVIKDLRDCPEHSTSKWHVDISANKLIEKLETKQLILHNVSQQSELLLFAEFMLKDRRENVGIPTPEALVEMFKNNNCG